MKLPQLRFSSPKRRKQIFDFRGINFSENYRDGEFSFTENLNTDLYPCLAPRLPRKVKKTLESPGGIYAGNDLFYIDGNIIYRNGEFFGELPEEHTGRSMHLINTKLCVFPDKVYFNLRDKDNYIMTRAEPSDWADNYSAYFTYDEGTEDFVSVSASSAPIWIGGRYYRYEKIHRLDAEIILGGGTFSFTAGSIVLEEESLFELYAAESFILRTENYYAYGEDAVSFSPKTGNVSFKGTSYATKRLTGTAVIGDIVRVREHETEPGRFTVFMDSDSSSGYWENIDGVGVVTKIIKEHYDNGTAADSDYMQIEIRVFRKRERNAYGFTTGFGDVFKPGDAIAISGCERVPENNLTLIVRDVIGNTLIFDDDVFSEVVLEPGTVKLSREVPDFDVLCEYNNRLFGADTEKIYVSALGDPTNWNTYDGLASDSYTVAVASPGKFTGCIGYSGNVLFFKEDMMYKLMGDYPENYALYPYSISGVCEGSGKSLVNIGERLFYHGRDGIYMYSGSLPQLISYSFGIRRFERAVGCGFGTKYYISMKEVGGDFALYVYDTLRDIWLREDSTEVLGFAEHGNERLMLTSSGDVVQIDSGEEVVSWIAETCEISEYIDNRKCYSKFILKLDMPADSFAKVEIKSDRYRYGWEEVWKRYGTNIHEGEHRNVYTANIPIRPTRCDRLKIRISGSGNVVIRSLTREFEVGSEV